MVEHNLAKVGVASSSLVFRSTRQKGTKSLVPFCVFIRFPADFISLSLSVYLYFFDSKFTLPFSFFCPSLPENLHFPAGSRTFPFSFFCPSMPENLHFSAGSRTFPFSFFRPSLPENLHFPAGSRTLPYPYHRPMGFFIQGIPIVFRTNRILSSLPLTFFHNISFSISQHKEALSS